MSRVAPKLKLGDEVRIICPSSSLQKFDSDKQKQIIDGFKSLGLESSFAEHCFKPKASIQDRIDDLYSAFADPDVGAVWAGTGGFSSIELLPHIDFGRLKNKIFCGYSDITVLLNAIYADTGLITYHAPNAGGLADSAFTEDYVKKALFYKEVFEIDTPKQWTDTVYSDNESESVKHTYHNDGWWPLNTTGIVDGRLVGGNLSCFSLLKSTHFMPKLKGSIVLVEDDFESQRHHFTAQFEALTLHEKFKGVEAILIGRFQKSSGIDKEYLANLVSRNPALQYVPVIANVDFGHTKPQLTLPIGGIVQVTALADRQIIKVIEH